MTKVEEIAKAVYEGRNGKGCDPWGRLPGAHKAPYLSDALAALKAIREPSEVMKRAGRIPTREILLGNGTTATGFGLMWGTSLMWEPAIDAVIAEHEGR